MLLSNFKKITIFTGLVGLSSVVIISYAFAFEKTQTPAAQTKLLTVEEMRIERAQQAMPKVVSRLQVHVEKFKQQIAKASSYTTLMQLVLRHGEGLWQAAQLSFETKQDYDDRALYWARLQMTKALRLSREFSQLLPDQKTKILKKFEQLTRGSADIHFNKAVTKHILITGFDPFLLDRNIKQSNPSGAAALALDGLTISIDGKNAQIQTLILPVRFADFDQGIVEDLLSPYLKYQQIDMLVTISMGRKHFDLERFPALRRSSTAPDNLNVYTGANLQNPIIPLLKGRPLTGSEFLEFSLPAKQMQQAQGDYRININGKVSVLTQGKVVNLEPKSINELANKISVQGSGGGYLSNEVSYRSLLLRDKYMPVLPVGHIHTPRIKHFDTLTNQKIVTQIKQMLVLALNEI